MTDTSGAADTRLATYGSLAPGRPNAHQLDALNGQWTTGTVRGRLVESGWGARLGYPALILDPDGATLEVNVFTSADLPSHWARLDAFEGDEYTRRAADIEIAGATVRACIYVHRV